MRKDTVLWVVDSMEENTAAIEQQGGPVYEIPRFLLPGNVREGDVCQVAARDDLEKGAVIITVAIDEKATVAAKQQSAAQIAATPKSKDPGGPIQL